MYYILNENYALRGWDKLPFALTFPNGDTEFLNHRLFSALLACNGQIDLEDAGFDNSDGFLEMAMEKGVIRASETPLELATYQVYRKHPSRYIQTAHWSITGHCNYRCRHCYMSAPDAKYGQLSTAECFDIVDQLAECGIRRVSLTGGEPLVRKDFWQIVDRILSYKMKITTVYSNGKLVTDALLDEFDKRGIKPEFNMSFDGVGKHDWLRGVDGAEKAVNEAFERCHKRGFPIGAELTLHRRNKDTLRESINHMAKLGVTHLKTNPAGKSGEWVKNGGEDHLSMEETYQIYLDYIPKYYEDGKPMDIMLGGFFMASKDNDFCTIPAKKYNGQESEKCHCVCGHARLVMYIAADGKILPCMALSGMDIQEKFPSLKEKRLNECISESYYMNLIDTRLEHYLEKNSRCGNCEHKYVCGGGCRAGALTDHPDDIMAPDESFCLIHRGDWIPKIEKAVAEATGSNTMSTT